MALIFINRFFHPDHSATSQMLSDLAFGLAARGHCVTVVTSRQRYDAPEVRLRSSETVRGVKIVRVATTRFGRSRLALRVVDYLTFYASAALALLRLAHRGDIVIAKTDPPLLSVLAAPLAGLKGAMLINWLQDVFPEVASALGVQDRLGGVGYRCLRWLRNRSLKAAALNVVIGEHMVAKLREFGVPAAGIDLIPNWTDCTQVRPIDPAQNALRQAWGLGDAFVVGYSGNLGRAHEAETLLAAITACERSEPTARLIRWLFVGGGAAFEDLRRACTARRFSSVQFRPYQPREQLAESLSAADLHLISLRPELEGLIVPSKVYGIAAAGRPAVFVGDSDGEVARLLQRHRWGVCVPIGDGQALASAILDVASSPGRAGEMGRRARMLAVQDFDKDRAIAAWDRLIASLQVAPHPIEARSEHRRA